MEPRIKKALTFPMLILFSSILIFLLAPQRGSLYRPLEKSLLFAQQEPTTVQTLASEVEAPRRFYFNLYWVLGGIAFTALWLYITSWISQDVEILPKGRTLWPLASLGTGLLAYAIALASLKAAAIIGTGVVLGNCLFYILLRDRAVLQADRLLTKKHFRRLLGRALLKLNIQIELKGPVAKVGPITKLSVDFYKKDGRLAETVGPQLQRDPGAKSVCANLVADAALCRATDIHLEPRENELQVRYRVDGILRTKHSLDPDTGSSVISAFKVLGDMDIAERRRPQDGNFSAQVGEKRVDCRVATIRSVYGEKMALRLLDKEAGLIDLDHLGATPAMVKTLRSFIKRPQGMLIICGPAGSGKTTSLYALLNVIDAYQRNVVTIEDPIEYQLRNITQTDVNPRAGVTFASSLRSLLRQDPDVLFIGEIRDFETAEIALQSAMTGHLILTTVHARDSITSVFRLLDLGVESFLATSALNLLVSERLIRRLCPQCKVPYRPKPELLAKAGIDPDKVDILYKAGACPFCGETGYRGRTGIFEILNINEPIQELIRSKASPANIARQARKAGFRPLEVHGLKKVIGGTTSIAEFLRVCEPRFILL